MKYRAPVSGPFAIFLKVNNLNFPKRRIFLKSFKHVLTPNVRIHILQENVITYITVNNSYSNC